MPIFEFSCNECGYRFEKLDRGVTSHLDCPACGSVDIKREISSFSSGASACCPPASSGG